MRTVRSTVHFFIAVEILSLAIHEIIVRKTDPYGSKNGENNKVASLEKKAENIFIHCPIFRFGKGATRMKQVNMLQDRSINETDRSIMSSITLSRRLDV